MKRKQLPQSLFPVIILFSLSSFLFVNLHANRAIMPTCVKSTLEQPKIEESDCSDTREIPVPDITVVGRLLEIAGRLIEVAR